MGDIKTNAAEEATSGGTGVSQTNVLVRNTTASIGDLLLE